ncbi:V-type proton ATPase 16 kDa proteolipid subunit [Vermiconidia calcicola]|uniref:V-type proton ATPase 16 kDa proteolipid subunit n=1 Tax=Vermiconidia calcicola TaxID=1690605 RepID=A0ACC3N9B1_9PEZI|nr:V-type proton ATPase 16 kDa proteolipid subunit [Vermiconidia calcicola]
MEAYSNARHAHTRTSHLTKLYSDAKKSALDSLEVQPNATQQFSALHRKYRIQKDRLITWGLAWSDEERGPDGNIDESVARAGLTETVDSVLRNIKEVTDEAERIKAASVPGMMNKAGDNKISQTMPFDEARYEDLLRDLTTSIDTLYDLSRSRKALARGEHPTFNAASYLEEKPSLGKAGSILKSLTRSPSYASSQVTLVNPPPFSRSSLSPWPGLPPRLDAAALRLSEEGPPPYESLGVPSTTRLVGRLVRSKTSDNVQNSLGSTAAEVPVLIEYANFDATYRDTGVPPPLQRLETLASIFQPMRPESQTNLSLLGYFEDFKQPRIGLVYDLPYSIQNRIQGTVHNPAQSLAPISLLKMVQKSNKPQPQNSEIAVPALEDRFAIALSLVEQLHEVHSRQIAHGNINSSSVIFTNFENDSPRSRYKQLRSPLWSSFDLFSKCSIEGVARSANFNIYKHPEDHPHSPGRSTGTDIKFDMYGLAILLLEVGLWTPIGELYKAKYTLADFKIRLERIWIPKLSAKCGSGYMRAVQACVAAADDLDLSQSMPVIESAYELVLRNIRRCCLLDENGMTDSFSPAYISSGTETPISTFNVRRKPLPTEKDILARQYSDTNELRRVRSDATAESGISSRLSSLPNLPSFDPQHTLARHPSERSQSFSRQSLKRRVSQNFTSAPSFKEYRRKVTLIQQKWREHQARSHRTKNEQANTKESAPDTKSNDPGERLAPVRKEYPQLQLPQAVIDDWHNRTSMQLAKLVERALRGSPESSSIALTAYGETPETARPTFLVCCTSTAKVKQVLKRHFKYDTSICDVRVKKDEIRRCRRPKSGQQTNIVHRSMAPYDVYAKAVNPDYQDRPLCGASIGAFRDDEHLPPVSFGGVLLVDGVSYGMSVHHMLEPEDDEDEEADSSKVEVESETSSIGGSDDGSDSEDSEDEETVRPASPGLETFTTADGHEGDCPGIVPGDYEEIPITQPALDDAIDLDLHVDEDDDDDEDSGIDEDHLLSYKLGQVHASSGLKRKTPCSLEGGYKSMSQSMPQEIDWALFELVPPRAQAFNIVKGGGKYCSPPSSSCSDSYPIAIKSSSELACAKVHCLGRTSGLAAGVVSSTMELVKIHGRSTFSASWTVDGDFGVGGDSGAWVINNEDGKVCGHVLASRRGRTYICPMDLLLEDIKTTLGAKSISLPAAAADKQRQPEGISEHQALTDAVRNLRMADSESGGVALHAHTIRQHSSSSNQFARSMGVAT